MAVASLLKWASVRFQAQASDIPAGERATVWAQLTGIKKALEKQLAGLEQLENSHE